MRTYALSVKVAICSQNAILTLFPGKERGVHILINLHTHTNDDKRPLQSSVTCALHGTPQRNSLHWFSTYSPQQPGHVSSCTALCGCSPIVKLMTPHLSPRFEDLADCNADCANDWLSSSCSCRENSCLDTSPLKTGLEHKGPESVMECVGGRPV